MTTSDRVELEIEAAKIRREQLETELAIKDSLRALEAHETILAAAPESIREYAQGLERSDWNFQVRFDLPNFSILGRISKMKLHPQVEWHWTRRNAWHHVHTLDEALVYGAEQGARWVDIPPPF
jgi:hypothetical protein